MPYNIYYRLYMSRGNRGGGRAGGRPGLQGRPGGVLEGPARHLRAEVAARNVELRRDGQAEAAAQEDAEQPEGIVAAPDAQPRGAEHLQALGWSEENGIGA